MLQKHHHIYSLSRFALQIFYTHYFSLYRLSFFYFAVYIIYVSYSYSADSWFVEINFIKRCFLHCKTK